jgi:hypothetical protein
LNQEKMEQQLELPDEAPRPGKEMRKDIGDACDAALAKLDKYYNISSVCCTAAIILDPRLKFDYYVDPKKTDVEHAGHTSEVYNQMKERFELDYPPDEIESAEEEEEESAQSRIYPAR